MTSKPVFLARCGTYDIPALAGIFSDAFDAIGLPDGFFRGKRVLFKPNLVLAKKPDAGATTHPAFLSALAEAVFERDAVSVVLADSPGGPYNAAALSLVYRICGMEEVDPRVKRNEDFGFRNVTLSGEKLRNVRLLSVLDEADVIVDVCKLKSHCLTGVSCATKNLFGLIPGFEKFEMHSTFPLITDFSEMLAELAGYVVSAKPFLAVCDGILSMEGNGPTHGTPKKTDCVLVSESPFALDVIAEHMMKRDGEVLHLDAAARRSLVPRDWREIPVVGQEEIPQFDFVRPDADSGHFLRNLPNFMGGRFAKLFEPRPRILRDKCVGCGKCAASCPRRTIEITERMGKRLARIHRESCIHCWCCQELCPIGAVGVWQNPLIRILR